MPVLIADRGCRVGVGSWFVPVVSMPTLVEIVNANRKYCKYCCTVSTKAPITARILSIDIAYVLWVSVEPLESSASVYCPVETVMILTLRSGYPPNIYRDR